MSKGKRKKIVLPNGRESARYKEIRPNILLACAYFSEQKIVTKSDVIKLTLNKAADAVLVCKMGVFQG